MERKWKVRRPGPESLHRFCTLSNTSCKCREADKQQQIPLGKVMDLIIARGKIKRSTSVDPAEVS